MVEIQHFAITLALIYLGLSTNAQVRSTRSVPRAHAHPVQKTKPLIENCPIPKATKIAHATVQAASGRRASSASRTKRQAQMGNVARDIEAWHQDDLVKFTAVKKGGLRLYVVYYLIGKGWAVEDEQDGRVWATLREEGADNGGIKGNLLVGIHCDGESGSPGSLRVRRLADASRPYMLKEAVALKGLIESLEELQADKSIPSDKRLFALEDPNGLHAAKEVIMNSVQ
ncbi:hypothetical protein AAMO2058_000149800 [Amorphochlora amoebiformis]